jgi:hypothetical protein
MAVRDLQAASLEVVVAQVMAAAAAAAPEIPSLPALIQLQVAVGAVLIMLTPPQ